MNIREMIKVMEAYYDGVEIEWRANRGIECWNECKMPHWNWATNDYRVKPKHKTVPLRHEDIPSVCWIRSKSDRTREYLVTVVFSTGVTIGESYYTFQTLFVDLWEYSSDRKTWKRCHKEVSDA